VNLSPLFPAAAAVAVQLGRAESAGTRFGRRLENGRSLSVTVREAGWEPVLTHPDHRSGILLVESPLHSVRVVPPDRLQDSFRGHGVTLTAFSGGTVRASLPDSEWGDDRLDVVLAAFSRVRLESGRGDRRRSSGEPGSGVGIAAAPAPVNGTARTARAPCA
jgi:hypothetical protein